MRQFVFLKTPVYNFTIIALAPLAQSVEQRILNPWVAGSSPARRMLFGEYIKKSGFQPILYPSLIPHDTGLQEVVFEQCKRTKF